MGVIIDSKANMVSSWNYTSKKFNLKIGFNKYEKYIGLPFKKILINLGIKKRLHSDIEKNYSYQSLENIKKDKVISWC